jgi:hypothetical protein
MEECRHRSAHPDHSGQDLAPAADIGAVEQAVVPRVLLIPAAPAGPHLPLHALRAALRQLSLQQQKSMQGACECTESSSISWLHSVIVLGIWHANACTMHNPCILHRAP